MSYDTLVTVVVIGLGLYVALLTSNYRKQKEKLGELTEQLGRAGIGFDEGEGFYVKDVETDMDVDYQLDIRECLELVYKRNFPLLQEQYDKDLKTAAIVANLSYRY